MLRLDGCSGCSLEDCGCSGCSGCSVEGCGCSGCSLEGCDCALEGCGCSGCSPERCCCSLEGCGCSSCSLEGCGCLLEGCGSAPEVDAPSTGGLRDPRTAAAAAVLRSHETVCRLWHGNACGGLPPRPALLRSLSHSLAASESTAPAILRLLP
jgi:hypothetical protein